MKQMRFKFKFKNRKARHKKRYIGRTYGRRHFW